MCLAINVSQSDFTGNYLHVAIQGKTRRKQNRTLAGMSAKPQTLSIQSKVFSANPDSGLQADDSLRNCIRRTFSALSKEKNV